MELDPRVKLLANKIAFTAYSDEYYTDTMFESSATELFNHPAYQKIISMGPEVIPLLITEIEKGHNHWDMALDEIIGYSPTTKAIAGRMDLSRSAWLKWYSDVGEEEIKRIDPDAFDLLFGDVISEIRTDLNPDTILLMLKYM